ncbi:MAG: riboflavin biosynthesis protein RibF [Amphiplicatus sp.]
MVTGRRIVAAIGNFDGVHRGHQRLVAETARFAGAIGAAPGAVVFDPHPRRYFHPDDPPFLLTTAKDRDALLKEAGAVEVYALAFGAPLAALSPEAFVASVLKAKLGLAGVVTGTEFRFGKGRAGDAEGLKRLAEAAGLEALLVAPAPEAEGDKISSSDIREKIAAGQMRAAAARLGRLWAVKGRVEPGRRLGRALGFATANMTLGELIEPCRGVYAVEAVFDGRLYKGVANFGRRPTVNKQTVGAPAPLLETHLFDFDGDLYGQTLAVRFVDFLREEVRFESLDALRAQIAADCELARKITG